MPTSTPALKRCCVLRARVQAWVQAQARAKVSLALALVSARPLPMARGPNPTDLSVEVTQNAFTFLDGPSLAACQAVCTAFRAASNDKVGWCMGEEGEGVRSVIW